MQAGRLPSASLRGPSKPDCGNVCQSTRISYCIVSYDRILQYGIRRNTVRENHAYVRIELDD